MTDTLATTNGKPLTVNQLTEEWGNRNLYKSSGFDRREFLPQLRGKRAAQVYKEMTENDPMVGAILFAIEMVLRRVDWDVEPGTDDDEGVAIAEFVGSCMNDMSTGWADLIADVLTMLPFGYSYLEVVYKQRVGPTQKDPAKRSRYEDSRVGWRKFMLIPQDTVVQFDFDKHGGVEAIRQEVPGGTIIIPIEKAVLFRTTKRTPFGRSVLRNSYLPWHRKKRIEEVEGIGIERDLAGLPVLYLDPTILADATRRSEYEDIVRNIRRDEQEGVLLPGVFDEEGNRLVQLELLSSGGSRQFDTDKVIGRYNRSIAMTVLQDVIMMGHERVGTQALATEKRDLSDTALTAWLTETASILNQHAIPRLLELNGMRPESPPTLVPGDLRQADILEFTEAIKNVAQAGFTVAGDPEVENFVRRRLGLPLMDPEAMAPMAQQAEEEQQAELEEETAAGTETPPLSG